MGRPVGVALIGRPVSARSLKNDPHERPK
nr:hypothetical protein [Hordeum vulgare subsp. vulgare]